MRKNLPPKAEKHEYLNTMRGLSVSMPVEVFNAVRDMAVAQERSMSLMAVILIKRSLKDVARQDS